MTADADAGVFSVASRRGCRRRFKVRRIHDEVRRYQKQVLLQGSDYRDGENTRRPDEDEKPTRILLSFSASLSTEEGVVVESACGGRRRSGAGLLACFPSTTFSHGSVSLIGRRREMEDAVRVQLGFVRRTSEEEGGEEEKVYDFFGVYDGHGGARVAEVCRERMHELVAEAAEGRGEIDWAGMMARCFGKMDEEVAGGCVGGGGGGSVEEMKTVGSTAVVAVVGREVVVVANCGDSRAVLSRGGAAVALSEDHKPNRPDELKRVEAAGGKVIHWNGHRILGVLATSRSIGDQYLKPFVISEPEVTVSRRTDVDEFLILASDGLWDVVSNEFACRITRRCLAGRMKRISQEDNPVQNRAAEAAAVLAEVAMARGSKDNISIIVVELNRPHNLQR